MADLKIDFCSSQDISLPIKMASFDTFRMWFNMGQTLEFGWTYLDGGGIEGLNE